MGRSGDLVIWRIQATGEQSPNHQIAKSPNLSLSHYDP
jgi:hypothetical protein